MVQLVKQRCHGIFLPMPDGYRKYQNQSSWSSWCSKQRNRVLRRLAFLHVFSRCNQFLLFPHFGYWNSKRPAGQLLHKCGPAVPAVCLDNDMGTGSTFCMKPPVTAFGELEGQFVVLQVVLSDIHIETVGRNIVERSGSDLHFFIT